MIDPADVLRHIPMCVTRAQPGWCETCGQSWPCEIAQVTTELIGLAEMAQIATALQEARAAGVMAFEAGVAWARSRNYYEGLWLKTANQHDGCDARLDKWLAKLRKERKRRKAAELSLWHAESWEPRAEAVEKRVAELEAALRDITLRVPIMGSTGEYRRGQLDALGACREVAAIAQSPPNA